MDISSDKLAKYHARKPEIDSETKTLKDKLNLSKEQLC